jgi:small conductance mechanosensitive channel
VRIITVLLRRVLGKTTLEQRVSKYIVSTVRFVLWVVTVLIVAQQLGIPVTSLVALFSVVSLAVSLAVQNVLANVAGGLVLWGITSIPPAGRERCGR